MKYPGLPRSAAAHDRTVAELAAGVAPPTPAYVIVRPAQPYDLATPGTPLGILAVARAAETGGLFGYRATFALAAATAPPEGSDGMVASLALRLTGDTPGRLRRAWVVYLRRADPQTGRSSWSASGDGGAALLDTADAARPVRVVGVEQLKAILRGEAWTPPAPRAVFTVPCPTCGAPARLTGDGRIYASHTCEQQHTEGRS